MGLDIVLSRKKKSSYQDWQLEWIGVTLNVKPLTWSHGISSPRIWVVTGSACTIVITPFVRPWKSPTSEVKLSTVRRIVQLIFLMPLGVLIPKFQHLTQWVTVSPLVSWLNHGGKGLMGRPCTHESLGWKQGKPRGLVVQTPRAM